MNFIVRNATYRKIFISFIQYLLNHFPERFNKEIDVIVNRLSTVPKFFSVVLLFNDLARLTW